MSAVRSIDGEALAAVRAAATSAATEGRLDDAERQFRAILEAAPADLEALNFLAVCAHGRGRLDDAIALLERARSTAAAGGEDATTLTNLGALYRQRGRIDEARMALEQALRAAPRSAVARLRLAETLEASGRAADALPHYYGAVMNAQGQGEWVSEATTPPGLKPLVLHAIGRVASGRRQLFHATLGPLRERYGTQALERVGRTLDMYLGDLPVHYVDPWQRPSFLYFPDLPTERFVPRERFPWYAALEAETDAIREEMLRVLAEDSAFEPFHGHFSDPEQLREYLRGTRGAPAWNAFFFHRHGVANEANRRRCPRTAAALDAAPLCRIRDHSPEVCYSVLTPGSHILPHRGVTNTRLVTHLPLVVPPDCALAVSGEVREWTPGVAFSFDDTFEHEAWNRSDQTRVVMLLDVWNPYLTDVEQLALTDLIGRIGDFNRASEAS